MNATSSNAAPTNADPVHWFGQSHRTIGGQADAHYGWLEHAAGVCVVKAMDTDLVAYNGTLLNHERQMLRRLRDISAPVPELIEIDGHPDWLVTRFAGVSMQRLAHRAGLQGAPMDPSERLAAWLHLLPRMQSMADKGVLVVDIHEANVVLPLESGTMGQLRLYEPVLVDHAHTLQVGMDMRRPVWLDRDMRRIAPELRSALKEDQEALARHFSDLGAKLPGDDGMAGAHDTHSRRVWAEYNAPQALQRLLDCGGLNAGRAMQFAAGIAIGSALQPSGGQPDGSKLTPALQRMTHADPAQRFPSLKAAADALVAAVGTVPLAGRQRFLPLRPDELTMPADAMPHMPMTVTPWSDNAAGTSLANGGRPSRPAQRVGSTSSTRAGDMALSRLYFAAATGAALGVVVPLPF